MSSRRPHRPVSVSQIDLLAISMLLVQPMDDDGPTALSWPALCRVAQQLRAEAAREGSTLLDLCVCFISSVHQLGACRGHGRISFVREALAELARINHVKFQGTDEDVHGLAALAAAAGNRPDASQRLAASKMLHRAFESLLVANDDTEDYVRPSSRAEVLLAVLFSPSPGAKDVDEQAASNELVARVSRLVARSGSVLVEVVPLGHGEQGTFDAGDDQGLHGVVVGAADLAIALAYPHCTDLANSVERVPVGTPCLVLAPLGAQVDVRLRDGVYVRRWNSESEFDSLVVGFARRLIPAAPPTAGQAPRETTPTQVADSPELSEKTAGSSDEPLFLPGMDDVSLVVDLDQLPDNALVRSMAQVLSSIDWHRRSWLSDEQVARARQAQKRQRWDGAAFRQLLAVAQMVKAYEELAPSQGVRTKRRNLDSVASWNALMDEMEE